MKCEINPYSRLIAKIWTIIEAMAINFTANGTATMITERLKSIPSTFTAAKNDRRRTKTYLLSLRFLAQRVVRISAIGPEKSMKDNKITARKAKEYIAASFHNFWLY
jgi:hypothetical protein